MKPILQNKVKTLLLALIVTFTAIQANAITLWVGETYTWDFTSSIMGSVYNLNVYVNGGYISLKGSGFYRDITPTQYFSGTAYVVAEWDYTLYYGDTKHHQRYTVEVTCRDNPVSIYPTSIVISPGETKSLSYSHQFNNQYVGAANAYFSGGNSSFSVTYDGKVTGIAPGSGYVNVYSKVSSQSPYCTVTVKDIEPTGATTGNYSVNADKTIDLSVSVTPSNATVKTKKWYVKSGSDVVSISGSRLTGLKPGTATIYCMINDKVRSNDATVTVVEPKLTIADAFPQTGATDISVFVNPYVTYSYEVSKGTDFSSITLKNGSTTVAGTVEISGSTVRFLPTKPLEPLTKYTLQIPSTAVKNKWGSAAQSDANISFTTADLEQCTVEFAPASGSYLTSSDRVTLRATPADAQIYYTIDGSTPTTSSTLYAEPITLSGGGVVKAFAKREGYKTSAIVTAEYIQSQTEVMGYYPSDLQPLFNYNDACPVVKFSGNMIESTNFRRISFTEEGGEKVAGEALLTGYLVVFVPYEPLKNSTTYTMDIPHNAIKTTGGEVFKGFSWSFTTATPTVDVSLRGDETVFVLNDNGNLYTRGMQYTDTNPSTGSYSFSDKDELTEFASGVDLLSSGYLHTLYLSGNTVNCSGLIFCGESGTPASIAAIKNIRTIRAGFQTSAIIDGSEALWMCGRNDFYQLCDGSGTTSKHFIKVSNNVIDVALGNGYTLYVDTDNVLWGVGRNHLGQLGDGTTENRRQPVKILEDVVRVYTSTDGFFSACITTDNQLLTWGDNRSKQLGRNGGEFDATPVAILSNVVDAALGEAHALALTDNFMAYAWGSNSFGQIGRLGNYETHPNVFHTAVRAIEAGPNTSILLTVNGEVLGYGRRSHNNLGNASGNADQYKVQDGIPFTASLHNVFLEPTRFEAKPGSRFALSAKPNPLNSDYELVKWWSENPAVASVEGNGIIQTGEIGETKVYVRFTNRYGKSAEAYATIVCTQTPDNSGVSDAEVDDHDLWSVRTEGCQLIIDGATIGATYTIYNMQGVEVTAAIAESTTVEIPLAQEGVYIVQSGNKAVKAVCK